METIQDIIKRNNKKLEIDNADIEYMLKAVNTYMSQILTAVLSIYKDNHSFRAPRVEDIAAVAHSLVKDIIDRTTQQQIDFFYYN